MGPSGPPWPLCHPRGHPSLQGSSSRLDTPVCMGEAKSFGITQLPLNSWDPSLHTHRLVHTASWHQNQNPVFPKFPLPAGSEAPDQPPRTSESLGGFFPGWALATPLVGPWKLPQPPSSPPPCSSPALSPGHLPLLVTSD